MSAAAEPVNQPQSDDLNPLDMPSLTTVAFFVIVIMAFQVVIPAWRIDLGMAPLAENLFKAIYISVPIMAVLRMFLSAPDRWIKRYGMEPLANWEPDLVSQVRECASQMGIHPYPMLFVTRNPGLSIQCFGTFRRRFIVVSRQEIDFARQDNEWDELVTMFAHELAHIRHGDNWKYMLAQQVVWVFMVWSLTVLLATLLLPDTIELWFVGSPFNVWSKLGTILVYPVIMGIQVYSLRLLRQIREHYADARAAQLMGQEAVHRALFASLRWRSPKAVKSSGRIGDLRPVRRFAPVLGFFGERQQALERVEALQKGAVLHYSVRRTMFISGFAMGIQWFSFNRQAFLSMDFYLIISALLFGVVYLIPRTDLGMQAVRSVLTVSTLMMAGVLSSLLLHTMLTVSEYAMSGASYAVVLEGLKPVAAGGYYLVNSMFMTVTLIIAAPLIEHLRQCKRLGRLPKNWSIVEMIVPVAFAGGVYVFLSAPLRYYDSSNIPLQVVGLLATLLLSLVLFCLLRLRGKRRHG